MTVSSIAVPLLPSRGHLQYCQVCESFATHRARRLNRPTVLGTTIPFPCHCRTTQAVSAGWPLICLATMCEKLDLWSPGREAQHWPLDAGSVDASSNRPHTRLDHALTALSLTMYVRKGRRRLSGYHCSESQIVTSYIKFILSPLYHFYF